MEVRRAVEAGVAWFKAVKAEGLRETKIDGVKKYSLVEIERERRNGYAWYGAWDDSLLREYAGWKARVEPGVKANLASRG